MASVEVKSEGTFIISWNIENFQFCWHKTGEYLESPIFKIPMPDETFWKLQLYPRGEDDGEYISVYLLREEGGPETVHIGFHLNLKFGAAEKRTYFLNMHSFKTHERVGHKCFAFRREVFAPKSSERDTFVLKFGCRIFSRDIDGFTNKVQILFTKIQMDRICGTEVFAIENECDSHFNEDIDIQPLLNDKPLMNINVSYIENSLVIRTNPVSCDEIKYAECKTVIFKNWGDESKIENVRSWVGKIKDIWRYQVPCQDTYTKRSLESFSHKTFILHFDFAFSTGIIVEKCVLKGYYTYKKESQMYGETLNLSLQERWYGNLKKANRSLTALDALEYIYTSGTFADMILNVTKMFRLHKALFCARSPKIRSMISQDKKQVVFNYTKHSLYGDQFFRFLYTDDVKILSNDMACQLFVLASYFEVELLKRKCREVLIDDLFFLNAEKNLRIALSNTDIYLKSVVEDYIVKNYDLVLSEIDWKKRPIRTDLRKTILLFKWKGKSQ